MPNEIKSNPTLVSFEQALASVKEVVNANPFFMEPYRKMAFWARLGKLAQENGKAGIYEKARSEFATLWNDPRRPEDVTGTLDALAQVFAKHPIAA